jgi:hypothetical protein
MSCRYQKLAIQRDERIRYLEQELKAVRLEITKLKAVIGSSNIVNMADVKDNIQKEQLNSLLTTYNLSHTIHFATKFKMIQVLQSVIFL